jgi:hypothetical protein
MRTEKPSVIQESFCILQFMLAYHAGQSHLRDEKPVKEEYFTVIRNISIFFKMLHQFAGSPVPPSHAQETGQRRISALS